MGTNFFIGDIDVIDLEFAKRVVFEENNVVILDKKANMWDVLVHLGVFKSKGQARKNWKKDTKIPDGYTDMLVGKKKRRACIWKPVVQVINDVFDESGYFPATTTYKDVVVNKDTPIEVIQELTNFKEV